MSLIAHYKLDGNANDSSGYGNHGTPYGTGAWIDGKIGESRHFSANDSIIQIPHDDLLSAKVFGKSNIFSFSCWLYIISYGSYSCAIQKAIGDSWSNTTSGIWLYSSGIRFVLGANVSGNPSGSSTGPVYYASLNKWHHIACVADGELLRLYVDGIQQGTDNISNVTYERTENTEPIIIGPRYIGGTSPSRFYEDDLRIYDHSLSTKEIKELSRAKGLHYKFDNGDNIIDCSGNVVNNATNNGAVFSLDSKIGKGCYQFDGSTTNIVIPNTNKCLSPHFGDFSVSFWMKSSSTANERIFSIGSYLNDYEIWKTSGIRATIADGSTRIYSTGSINIADNAWHHIAVVYNRSGNSVVYVDTVIDPDGTNNISSMADIDLDPTTIYLGSYGTSGSYRYTGLLDDLRFFNTALFETDIKELAQTRASIDKQGNFSTHFINETKHQPLIYDYTNWTVGTTGLGTIGQFTGYGDDSIILAIDPFGKETAIWQSGEDFGIYESEGRIYCSTVLIDPTKMYRMSYWEKRVINGPGEDYGRYYFGMNSYGSTNGVYERSNNAGPNTNPYFWSTSYSGLTEGQWFLIIGHVWPAESGAGDNHIDSGRWDVTGNKIGNISTDYIWHPNNTSGRPRTLCLYRGGDINTIHQSAYPRMDICDGTEPSINELLAGFDSNNIDYVRSKGGISNIALDVGSKITNVGEISEVGPTNGLVAYYPLNGDAEDYSGNGNDGTVYGATLTSGLNGLCYQFLNSGDKILIPSTSYDIITYCTWHKWDTVSTTWRTVFGYSGNIHHMIFNNNRSINIWDGSQRNFGYNSPDNNWHHYAIILYSADKAFLYVDGEYFSQVTTTLNINTYPLQYIGNSGGNSYPCGNLSDARIYNLPLPQEDINILYNMTNPESTQKMKQTKGCLYIKGQFKEIY